MGRYWWRCCIGLQWKIINNVISHNSCIATEYDAYGGGIKTACESQNPCTVFIEDNHITHNVVKGKGASTNDNWAAFGGGIENRVSKVLILNNEISHNQLKDFGRGEGSGAGIYMYLAASGSKINGNTISNNKNEVTDGKYGGGIGLGTTHGLSITNNIISGNSASQGGGIRLRDFYTEIINNTIVNNTASTLGGGIYSHHSNPKVINTILWDNDAPINSQISGTATVRYSDVQFGYSGAGNINSDPLFVDAENGNFQLTENSYCIGGGVDSIKISSSWYFCPHTDFDGSARPYLAADEFVDMGALESQYQKVTSLEEKNSEIPTVFALYQNYPNPFNPSTTIEYQIPAEKIHEFSVHVELSIYNLLGQKVATLVSTKQPAGSYKVEWDATGFTSGLYFYRLETDKGFLQTRKLIVLK